MAYSDRCVVARAANLTEFVPSVEVVSLDAGRRV
jgi:hypothetical protein